MIRALPLALALLLGCAPNLHTRGEPTPEAAGAPSFTLPDETGREVSLSDLTADGPAVVVFYRGFW